MDKSPQGGLTITTASPPWSAACNPFPFTSGTLAAEMSACDSDKITRLYRDEAPRLERQIARRIGNASIARDLVHDVFLRFWERATELRGNPAALITRSAHNRAIDHLRRESTRSNHAAHTQMPLTPTDPAFDRLAARQSGEAVRRAIEALPETTRRLFLMNRVQGMSFQQIAAACGMSERNVAKHMAKAVARCAEALEDQRNQ